MEFVPPLNAPVVLVVDDQLSVRLLFHRMLVGAGFAVHAAADGFDAIAAARQQRPDAILLDGDLPVLDGYEVCRLLKADTDTCSIPIVFVTAMSGLSYRDAALDAGADAFVTKPVDMPALVARLRSLIGSGSVSR